MEALAYVSWDIDVDLCVERLVWSWVMRWPRLWNDSENYRIRKPEWIVGEGITCNGEEGEESQEVFAASLFIGVSLPS